MANEYRVSIDLHTKDDVFEDGAHVDLVETESGEFEWELHLDRSCRQPLFSYITTMVCESIVKAYRRRNHPLAKAVVRAYYAVPFSGVAAKNKLARSRRCAQALKDLLVAYREALADMWPHPSDREFRELDHAGNFIGGDPLLPDVPSVSVNLNFTDLEVELVETESGESEWDVYLPRPCRQPLHGRISRAVFETVFHAAPQLEGVNWEGMKGLLSAYREELAKPRKRLRQRRPKR